MHYINFYYYPTLSYIYLNFVLTIFSLIPIRLIFDWKIEIGFTFFELNDCEFELKRTSSLFG